MNASHVLLKIIDYFGFVLTLISAIVPVIIGGYHTIQQIWSVPLISIASSFYDEHLDDESDSGFRC